MPKSCFLFASVCTHSPPSCWVWSGEAHIAFGRLPMASSVLHIWRERCPLVNRSGLLQACARAEGELDFLDMHVVTPVPPRYSCHKPTLDFDLLFAASQVSRQGTFSCVAFGWLMFLTSWKGRRRGLETTWESGASISFRRETSATFQSSAVAHKATATRPIIL